MASRSLTEAILLPAPFCPYLFEVKKVQTQNFGERTAHRSTNRSLPSALDLSTTRFSALCNMNEGQLETYFCCQERPSPTHSSPNNKKKKKRKEKRKEKKNVCVHYSSQDEPAATRRFLCVGGWTIDCSR